jgi:hypothetical protein
MLRNHVRHHNLVLLICLGDTSLLLTDNLAGKHDVDRVKAVIVIEEGLLWPQQLVSVAVVNNLLDQFIK